MIKLKDGRDIEIISIRDGQVDFRVLNADYRGAYVAYAAVSGPAAVKEDLTDPDEIAQAMQTSLEAAIAVAEPIVKQVLDNPPANDARTPSARDKAIIDNFPSWTVVANAVDNIASLADAKAYLKKLSRVVYWLAKNSEG
jgi:hypothetical protein